MKLTARDLIAAAIAEDDVLHIVDISDISGGASGTSFKTTRSQISTQTFANDAARTAAKPGFIGQLGVQLDTGITYRGSAFSAGSWIAITSSIVLYNRYVALITQASTSAPTAVVLENTLGGTVVWTRSSQGIYTATLASVFTANKTFVLLGKTASGANSSRAFSHELVSTSAIDIHTGDTDGHNSTYDDRLSVTPIEIRVYP